MKEPDMEGGPNRTGSTGTKSVDRALAVLAEFRKGKSELGITELADRLGLSPSTVHRLVQALMARGYLSQDGRSGRYRLGLEVLHLGRVVERFWSLERIRPLLERLAEETQESVNLVHRQANHTHGIIVDRVESRLPLRFSVLPGDRVPIHCSAGGKAMLAFSPNLSEAVASLGALPSMTHKTITDPALLEEELLRTRERGYSIDDEEFVLGARCIAEPIFNASDIAFAAVAIQAPLARMSNERIEQILPILSEATSAISTSLEGLADQREEPVAADH